MTDNKNKKISNIILWIIIGLLVVVIITQSFVLIKKVVENREASPSPSFQLTAAPSGETPPAQTQAASPDSSSATAPVSTSGGAVISTSAPPSIAKDNAVIGGKDIDFSFLSGVSTEAFEDGNPQSDGTRGFDWYPGSVERSSDGRVNYKWDRFKSTLDTLDKYNGIYRQNTDKDVLYLTFDCGYEYGYTGKILDVLKEKNVKAIFFVTGGFLDDSDNHALLKRMYNEGHLIGNHTNNHPIMPTVSNQTFVDELDAVYKKCKDILGDSFTMSYYRPPQGASNERDLCIANYLGYKTVFWSFAYGDYNVSNQPEPAAALEKLKSWLHPGAVYLLHAVSSTNTAILGEFIDYVKGEGFELRRIDG